MAGEKRRSSSSQERAAHADSRRRRCSSCRPWRSADAVFISFVVVLLLLPGLLDPAAMAAARVDSYDVAAALEDAIGQPVAQRTQQLQSLLLQLQGAAALRGADAFAPSFDGAPAPSFAYELLASHYAAHPQDATDLEATCVRLWSNPHLPPLYAMLFYAMLFRPGASLGGVSLKRRNICLDGVLTNFWADLNSGGSAARPIYEHLRGFLLRVRRSGEDPQPLHELYVLLSRFVFLYDGTSSLGELVSPAALLECGLGEGFATSGLDAFVLALSSQMRSIKSEEVLLRYLQHCAALRLRVHLMCSPAQNKLRATLQLLSQSGAPLYATAPVRRQAAELIDVLWPHGKIARSVIRAASDAAFHPVSVAERSCGCFIGMLLWPLQALWRLLLWCVSAALMLSRSRARAASAR